MQDKCQEIFGHFLSELKVLIVILCSVYVVNTVSVCNKTKKSAI